MEDAEGRALFEALAAEDPGWATRAAADPDRPRYHFQPAPGWMNDPIPFFSEGRYDVVFQCNPGCPYWGDMQWGHACSADLCRWQDPGPPWRRKRGRMPAACGPAAWSATAPPTPPYTRAWNRRCSRSSAPPHGGAGIFAEHLM